MTAAPTPVQVISPTPFTPIRLPGHRLSRRRGYTTSARTGLRTARHFRCGMGESFLFTEEKRAR